MQIREQLNRIYAAVNQIEDVREQTEALKRRLPADDSGRAVASSADGLVAKLVAVREPLANLRISANEDSLAYRPGLDGQFAFLSMIVDEGCDCGPTAAALASLRRAEEAGRRRCHQMGRSTEKRRGTFPESRGRAWHSAGDHTRSKQRRQRRRERALEANENSNVTKNDCPSNSEAKLVPQQSTSRKLA